MTATSQQQESTDTIKEILVEKKIQKLTDIQKKALPAINTNDNLVIVAPSGAGKTLIAELERSKKSQLLMPKRFF
ncbi:MAG: DEAD/DEAH box helicase [Candidatus Heimdallarchaeota archaeon]